MTHDDPRLTAWALGELSESERAEVDALLAADPALRAEADALRAAAGALREGLAAEAVPVLDPAHRGAIEEALGTVPSHPVHGRDANVPGGLSPVLTLRSHAGLGALAATLLLAIGFAVAGGTGAIEFEAQGGPGGDRLELCMVDGDLENADAELEQRITARPARPALALPKVKSLASPLGKGGATNGAQSFYLQGVGGGGGGGGHLTKSGRRRVALEYFGTPFGGVTNQRDGEIQVFSVTVDQTATINDPAGAESPTRTADLNQPLFGNAQDAGVESSTESFAPLVENAWVRPRGEAALSTFSIDVDTAAYSIVRRCLVEQKRLPPPGALRIEELVNYFPYRYDPPAGSDPFAVAVDAASCPWNPRHRLVRIALKGREVEEAARPAANLVLLLDVSGSMNQENKLPLVKKTVGLLAGRLTARDRVAIVVYAGASGLVLPSTAGDRQAEIRAAIDNLSAGGSTNGGAGIELAYKVAAENFVAGGINRVVLATDGDFNVGVSDPSALVKLVEEKAKTGVFLTALGYGMDNLKDSTLEQLADKGNGNYGYIDDLREAEKVLVTQGMSTLHAIAKDVKIQVEFNPTRVAAYRLVGYENRVLAAQDFADDGKDAGEIGAGHCVTALYEVVPAGEATPGAPVDELRYQRIGGGAAALSGVAVELESLTVKLRWKKPEGSTSTLREVPFMDDGRAFDAASADFRFAAAVAQFGQLLRGSEHRGTMDLAAVAEVAAGALGDDPGGWRAEFLSLVQAAAGMQR